MTATTLPLTMHSKSEVKLADLLSKEGANCAHEEGAERSARLGCRFL
jgi:hypothetical protein